jgi:ATP-dependent RNA helicase DeaD
MRLKWTNAARQAARIRVIKTITTEYFKENLMTNAFEEFGLAETLTQAVAELGYVTPTPIQSAVIPRMLEGRDVIGQAQTGTGKTAAYALPMLNNLDLNANGVQCLVLVPTRELAIQVATAISDFGKHSNVRVLAIYGGQSYNRQIGQLKRGVHVVVGTPGRLLDLIRQEYLSLKLATMVILDEADEMLSMGFIEDIEAILADTPAVRQTALFSATMPTPIRRLADRYLQEPQFIAIQSKQRTVEAIEQRYYLVNESEKTAALTRLFEIEPITSALVFARTRASSGELANELTRRGFAAEVLNGDLAQETREQVLNRFRNHQVKVLVATDVAARGLDIDDISHVINFDLPEDEEIYVHRVGRTGRAGKTGIALSLVTPGDQWRLKKIESFTRQPVVRTEVPSEEAIILHRETLLLNQMSVWLQRARYQRERELVSQLIDQGIDPLEIAAAALKMARSSEKQRPIAPISEVREHRQRNVTRSSSRTESNPSPRSGTRRNETGRERYETSQFNKRRPERERQSIREPERQSHEEGMVRVSISKGRQQGVRPSDVVSTIAYHANIPGFVIGKILIQDHHTLVDVPQEHVAQVLAQADKYRLNKQGVTVEVA